MSPKASPKVPRPPGVDTALEANVGPLEEALTVSANAADWLELSDAAALELGRNLARQVDQTGDPHASRTLLAVLEQLGLTVRGRRDRQPVEAESPLARLQASARRQLGTPTGDADVEAAVPRAAARRAG
jgi:hypothetical protein